MFFAVAFLRGSYTENSLSVTTFESSGCLYCFLMAVFASSIVLRYFSPRAYWAFGLSPQDLQSYLFALARMLVRLFSAKQVSTT
jgi:hypothetical protein